MRKLLKRDTKNRTRTECFESINPEHNSKEFLSSTRMNELIYILQWSYRKVGDDDDVHAVHDDDNDGDEKNDDLCLNENQIIHKTFSSSQASRQGQIEYGTIKSHTDVVHFIYHSKILTILNPLNRF